MSLAQVDYFSSIHEMKNLVKVEKEFIDMSEKFISQYEQLLKNIKSSMAILKAHQKVFSKDPAQYLLNPINSYHTIKMLTVTLNKTTSSFMSTDLQMKYYENLVELDNKTSFPTMAEYQEAVRAIRRLQETYHLEAADLAEGKIRSNKTNVKLNSEDCFNIGLSYLEEYYYAYATEWFNEAYLRINDGQNISPIELYRNLSYSNYASGHIANALYWIRKVFDLDPDDTQLPNTVKFYESILINSPNFKIEANGKVVVENVLMERQSYKIDVFGNFEKLCRGELVRALTTSKYNCFYLHRNVPFLKIAPFKAELVSVSPRIVVYHDVIYDDEIEVLKNLSAADLTTAGTLNANLSETVKIRLGKLNWILHDSNEATKRVSARAADMTGLNMEDAERIQVLNYGMGGHYFPHNDGFDEDVIEMAENRIATIVFYLNNVEQGGSTVFDYLKVSVKAEKGKAIFWYDMLPSGSLELRNRHASCPILMGTKWISNIWVKMGGQELHRPCGIHEKEEYQ